MSVDDRNEWFRSAFSKDYLRIYSHRDTTEAEHAISAVVDGLSLPPQSLCLDLCCGFGRHLPPLNAAGLSVIGCDLSMDLLCSCSTGAGRLIRGNMAALPFADSVFAAVFSFFTSFGYFDDDDANAGVIAEIARVLAPSGRLVMDFLNPDWVRATLVPEDETHYDEFLLTQRRWIDDSDKTVNKELVVNDGAERRYRERVKLYGVDDFNRFFAAAGLTVVQTMGDYNGRPFQSTSPRQIYIAVKS